jgi:hypothetical protein
MRGNRLSGSIEGFFEELFASDIPIHGKAIATRINRIVG